MTSSEYELINSLRETAVGIPLQLIGAAVGWYYAYRDTKNVALALVAGLSLPDAIGFFLLLIANVLHVIYTSQFLVGYLFVFIPFFLFPGLVIGMIIFFAFWHRKIFDGSFGDRTSNFKLYILTAVLIMLNVGVVWMGYLIRTELLE